jgi:hypothetical protein
MTHLTKIPNSMRLHLYAACVHVKTQGKKRKGKDHTWHILYALPHQLVVE